MQGQRTLVPTAMLQQLRALRLGGGGAGPAAAALKPSSQAALLRGAPSLHAKVQHGDLEAAACWLACPFTSGRVVFPALHWAPPIG